MEFTWFSGRVIYCLGSNYQNFLSSLLYFAKDGKRHILNKTVLRHKSSGELAHERRRGDTVPNWQRGAVSSELSHPALHKHRRLCPAVQRSGRISTSQCFPSPTAGCQVRSPPASFYFLISLSVPATLGQIGSPTPLTKRGSIPSKFFLKDTHCY